MKAITSIKRALTVTSLAIAGFLIPAPAQAVQLTYDLRVTASSSGLPVVDPHNFLATQPGEVLTIGIFAVLNSANALHTDDGMTAGQGSIKSAGLLLGNMRGDTAAASIVNNREPFLYTVSGVPVVQSGYLADLDADGDLDLGTNLTTANNLNPLPWFIAITSNGGTNPVFGTGAGTGGTEFLIGESTCR